MTNTNLKVPKESIPYILRKGNSSKSKLFVIRLIKNDRNSFRYRVIISKKLLKEAVQRNKLRRQIYEILRTETKDCQQKPTYDIILIPKKTITLHKFEEIRRDIKDNILNKPHEQTE